MRALGRLGAFVLAFAAACGGGDDGPPGVSGTVQYEDRPQTSAGSLGGIQLLPARGVQISLIAEADGAVLVTGVTGDDGTYRLDFPEAGPAELSHLLVATISESVERPIQVHNRARAVHGFGGASFAADETTQDVVVTAASNAAEAFNVFDQLVLNADTVRETLGVMPPPLTAIWQQGSQDGTYYSGSTLHLLGAPDDDDGYDDSVILHEAGHFVEDTVGRSDSPGGGHDGSPTNPTLAWSEGFSTYWAMAALGAPFYGDSNSGGGWSYDGDTSATTAEQPSGGMDQDVSEDMITEILWDLGDAGAADDDSLPGDQTAVRVVQPLYLRTAVLRTVGRQGVDLVDFLDGFFVANGLADCAGVRNVVTGTRRFPYDYAGPAGACP